MVSPVGPLTRVYLRRCGYGESEINKWNGGTRLLQDIGLVGDSAWDEFTRMHRDFGVDLTELEIDKYFPPELSGARLVVSFFGWTEFGKRLKERYPAVTLDMIETTLAAKKWKFE
ncbi:DUF1493 family protein [Methylocystis sp. JAN1]|uniref:DUF1493 family protein n=1 Tax=Methylocystis sp. JAN1 TaxID=3397211 RepID=UPI003FA1A714